MQTARFSFNPRTREGCDSRAAPSRTRSNLFQSTHPRRVRRSIAYVRLMMQGFNPRTREGCDVRIRRSAYRSHRVSIHAPAKGATCRLDLMSQSDVVSIHAPAKGATKDVWQTPSERLWFQSTHPRRVRPLHLMRKIGMDVVSIHAPAKGATDIIMIGRTARRRFNPRTREGCDEFRIALLPRS